MTLARTLALLVVGGLTLLGGLWWLVARLSDGDDPIRRPTRRPELGVIRRGHATDGSLFDRPTWRAR